MDDMQQPAPAPEREVIEVTPREPKEAPKSAELPKPEAVEEPKPAKSIREALEGAKVKAEEKAEAKKPPEPKQEPKQEEKPEKAEPKAEEPVEEKATRDRAPDGKFAAKEQEEQPKRQSSFREAPSRFDEGAKKDWESVPESVRGAIHRSIRESEHGIQKYRQSADEYESIREYADMARQHGTNLRQALDNYVGIEKMLRQNPMQGLEQIVANLGLKDNQGQPVTFRALAMAMAGQKPEAVSAQQDRTISELRQQVQQLTQQVGGVSQYFQEQQTLARTAAAENEWQSFVKDNPRASALENDIADLLKNASFGDNVTVRDRLDMAYAIAERRHPDTNAAHTGSLAQTQTPEPRQPNPAGQKSISGSPAPGTLTPSAKPKNPPSIQDALRDAARRAGRSV